MQNCHPCPETLRLTRSVSSSTLEHMFESLATTLNAEEFDPAWVAREPVPGEAGYDSYRAYEEQQIAFWNAYAASDAPPDALLNLNAARTDAGLLGEIGRAAQHANAAEGRKLRAIADYAFRAMANPIVGYDEQYIKRSVEAEVALELKVPPSAASELVGLALMLAQRLPKTFATLQRGEVTKRAAELIAEESANLNVAQCAELEQEVLPEVGERSHRSLQAKVRREVEKLDADAVRKRAEKAKEERCLYLKDGHDGMATLCLEVPTGVAQAIYAAINEKVLAAQTALKAE